MAARKKAKGGELVSQADPRASLAGEQLLAAAKPLLKDLAADLLARADGSLAVTEVLQARHAADQKAERTADGYQEWRRAFVEQVAAAWLLSCVFVRTLEDRGLLGRSRIAGAGAEDSWKSFLHLAPSLSEREYLLAVFRELSRLPAAADLFDARHNPVWLLAPSAEGARKLLELFRSPTADTPAFRFGGEDTRFLGDLYQDLSEEVRKRYALLQTPRFVEKFILDRTLDPAIERFGLNETTLVDPTCGSGHFLLGAFERLFDRRLHAEPGLSAREAATKALDAIAGADINPYAIAIARFRLTLAFVEKCGGAKLKDVARLPLHLVVADSLLYNPQLGQLALLAGTDPVAWEGAQFALEDPTAARDVLLKQYAAVVGNPPYITVKDAVLRDRYRANYSAAYREYSLAVPFMQRFFQLGRDGASVGMITANSFMKREFGKRLIEEYLPTVNLELIVNTSGAYIPGHGTPTVLLFGTTERAKGTNVLAVLANRGEPTTPEDAERGLVWSSIAGHWSEVGFENEYISVSWVERGALAKHPWSLGGGGAGELKELLEARADKRLADVVDCIGFVCMTRADDVYFAPRDALRRARIDERFIVENVEGEVVRDWAILSPNTTVFPYDGDLAPTHDSAVHHFLWPYRTLLWLRREPNGNHREIGLTWWEWSRFQRDRFRAPLLITFAFVATHNHFVLDRGGKVFKQSAPIIKLPTTATEDDHLALLAYLNSSTACFWMKQVFYPKGSVSKDIYKENGKPEDNRYEFAGTGLEQLPIPHLDLSILVPVATDLELLAAARSKLDPAVVIAQWIQSPAGNLADMVTKAEDAEAALLRRMIAVQEDLDWLIYCVNGLAEGDCARRFARDVVLSQGERPFVASDPPEHLDLTDRELWVARRRAIHNSPELALLEQQTYKRRWLGARGIFASKVATYQERAQNECLTATAAAAEGWLQTRSGPESLRSLRQQLLADAGTSACMDLAARSGSVGDVVGRVVWANAVPYLAALTFTPSGLEKRRRWEDVWNLQRREDQGEKVEIVPPPKFDPKDHSDFSSWSLRGKLDVPKERFISYPGCESDEDHEPVYGWAGWDHLQRAVALAGLYQARKQREGWAKDRLKPMLAGLLEILPWLKQWHDAPSADLGGERPSDQFEAFIEAECAEHGFTHDELRAWRPTKGNTRKAKKTKDDQADAEESP